MAVVEAVILEEKVIAINTGRSASKGDHVYVKLTMNQCAG